MDWLKSSRGKKTEDYEKEYISRYKKDQKTKPKKKTSKEKKSAAKDSVGKILEYEITLNTKVLATDFITGKKILNQTFVSSVKYKAQDQYSDTIKLENQSLENLINKTFQELLIKLSHSILSE